MSNAKPYNPAPTNNPMPAVPAATVVLVRDPDPGDTGIEVLMLKRTGGGAFGGFWVFPGGRVDPEDEDELATAVREAKEESGIDLDRNSFVRFSHWMPPEAEIKRFSTWFFVARAPHLHDVAIDEGEIVDHAWVKPLEMLERRERGEIELAPPTFVTLFEIGRHADVESVLAAARAAEPFHFVTRIHRTEDKRAFTVWSGDVAYDDASLIDADGARHRIELTGSPWSYTREF